MSDAKITAEMLLESLINTFQELADANRTEANSENIGNVECIEALARADVYGAAAELLRKNIVKLGDLPTARQALLEEMARATYYETLLKQHGIRYAVKPPAKPLQ